MKYIVDIKGEIEGDYEIIGKYEDAPQGEKINDFAIKVNIPEEAKKKLIEELQKEPPRLVVDYNPEADNFALGYAEGFNEGKKHRPQGDWIETSSYDENIICSSCKTEFNGDIKLICGGENPNFCPECGADMRGGVK